MKNNFWLWILIAIAVVAFLFGLVWHFTFNVSGFDFPKNSNEFGDSFGMANAIFSALAFAFLIVTAIMQKNELALQRKELGETKIELKRSADAQKETVRAMGTQVSILAKQALLSSYQSMYGINMNIVNSNDKSPLNKEDLLREANSYKFDMQELISEIESDMKLFGDPLYPEKRDKLREIAQRFVEDGKDNESSS